MVKPVPAEPVPNIGTLLLQAFQAHERLLFHRLEEAGFRDLRPKHGAALANIEDAGTRPSVIAERAALSRPAMAEVLDDLEQLGYLRRVDDPRDGRAKLARLTDRGRDCVAAARGALSELEAQFEDVVGAHSYAIVRRSLRELIDRFGTGHEVAQPRL